MSSSGERRLGTKEVIIIAAVIYFGWGLINTDDNLVLMLGTPIMQALHLTVQQYSYVLSAGFATSFVMSLILGPLGDRLGRRFLLQLTLLGTAVFSMLQYFINGFGSWLLIRMGAEAFTGSEWGAGATYLTETIGKRLRGLALSIMQSGWVFGYGLASVIAYFTLSHWGMSYGWRVAFLFAFLPAIVVLVLRSRLKETDRFEHLREIRDAKRRGDVAKVEELLEKYKVDVEASVRPSYRQLLGPDLRRVAIILAFYNFLTTGVAIVGDSMFPYYLSQVKGFNYLALISMFATLSFIGIVGYLANGLLNDRIGAKWPVALFAALQTLGIFALVILVKFPDYIALWSWYFLYLFTHNGQFAGLIRLNTEAFPTRVRAAGALWSGAFWSLGQSVWPLVFSSLIPVLGFNGAWIWVEIVPELIAIALFAALMRNIPPQRELEEIAI
ncbi:MAG: MFS transporter [Nitrososphaeria archaeon]